MSFRRLAIALALAVAAMASAVETIDHALRRHHVALTRSGLLSALRNPEPEVRGLAAAKLAQDRTTEAIPDMVEALAAESVPLTKMNIAFALAQLGNQEGSSTLVEACHDPEFNYGVRLEAAHYMLALHSNACLPDVIELTHSKDESNTTCRFEALSLLPEFKGASEQETQEILGSLLEGLLDTNDGVRISAANGLSQLGNTTAIQYLLNSIATERDDTVRGAFKRALKSLQDKK
jgi:HEAT repeat protein